MASLKKLREMTASLHTRIEGNPLLRKLTQKDLSLDGYIQVLEKFYGFYVPFEAFYSEQKKLMGFSLEMGCQSKIPLLGKDLSYFKVDIDQIPISPYYPAPDSIPSLLGCLYVLEGSALGRAMMWPQIAKQFQLHQMAGGGFFYGRGRENGQAWRKFCEKLEEVANSQEEEMECIQAAMQTFDDLDQWFKK